MMMKKLVFLFMALVVGALYADVTWTEKDLMEKSMTVPVGTVVTIKFKLADATLSSDIMKQMQETSEPIQLLCYHTMDLSFPWIEESEPLATIPFGEEVSLKWTAEDKGFYRFALKFQDGSVSGQIITSARHLYVDAEKGDDANVGTDEAHPFKSIQRAIDLSENNDLILVNDGVYDPIVSGNKRIRIVSVNGPEKTIIDGGGTNRCATLALGRVGENDPWEFMDWCGILQSTGNDTRLEGFCLRNGYSERTAAFDELDLLMGGAGGGVAGGTLDNCVIEYCLAEEGAGARLSNLNRCIVRNCICFGQEGGGAFGGKLVDCLITGNDAGEGGGASYAELVNCTVVDNSISGVMGGMSNAWSNAWYGGGQAGVMFCSLQNCIVCWNYAIGLDPHASTSYGGACMDVLSDVERTTARYNDDGTIDVVANGYTGEDGVARDTCIYPYVFWGETVNCLQDDPCFYDREHGDYRLLPFSPCIDRGANVEGLSELDVGGRMRVVNGRVDIGAYEWQTSETVGVSTVTFDLGEHCRRIGGGELVQTVTNTLSATAPFVQSDAGWLHVGWDRPLTKIVEDTIIRAVCREVAEGTVVLSGEICEDRVLSSVNTYLINGQVKIASGAAVTIPPQTVIKFMSGSKLVVSDGGCCLAAGAIFTHVNDDTVGGDTLMDGGDAKPRQDDYKVIGIVDDETTEYRYYTQPVATLSGTISKNETWKGHQVYHVTGNLTIAAGANLTIEPGAIVKFDPGLSLTVNSGATLSATGTRAQPIVFTSVRDDEHGGDTNGDGSKTTAQPGAWRNLVVAGKVNLESVELLYGGGASTSLDTGMISVRSRGSLVVDNSRIMYGLYDGIFSYGTVTGKNTVIYDCDRGVNTSGGSGVFRNCVIDHCRWGVMSEGGSGTYFNCIITRFYGSSSWPTGWGVAFWSGSLKAYNCDVWSTLSGSSNYKSSPSVANNISADPQFLDPDNGDFRIAEKSPCVDAGDGTVAPATDYFGQTRQTLDAAKAKGKVVANGNYPDIGIYEVMPKTVTTDVDLAVTKVEAPASLAQGETVTVSWTVRNEGTELAAGQWMDRVELVCANGSAVELGTREITARIPAGAEQVFTGTWRIPAAQAGTVRVRVTANVNRDVFEGTATANNIGFALDSTLTLPTLEGLSAETATTIVVPGSGVVSYALGAGFTAGGYLVMRSSGKIVARTGNGQVPTADTYYGAPVKVADGIWLVSVPEGGLAYLMIENEGAATADVEIAYYEGAFALYDVENIGTYYRGSGNDLVLTVYGNGFVDEMVVALVGAGTVIASKETTVSEGGAKLVATFAEEDCVEGDFHIRVTRDGLTLSRDAVTIKNRATGALPFPPKMEYSLEMLSTVRQGREYMGYIVYGNKGMGAGNAPYLRVTAANGSSVRFSQSDAWSTELELMGISQTYPASQIKVGESVKVPFYYMTSSTSADITLGVASSADGDFPWETNGRYMRPSWADDEFWGLAFAILKANVGMTWNDWLKRMRHNSDYLMKLGKPTYRLEPLWQLEVNEALGVDHVVLTLAGGTDLVRSGRGMGLALRRSYGAAFYSRFKKGLFGYGWSDNYSVWAELQDSDSTLAVHSGDGSTYRFYKANGAWAPEDARDKTKVIETSNEYVLTYRSGTVQRIGKANMRVASIADNQGNGIVFTYADGGRGATARLVRVAHTDGQTLTFAHAGDKLVSATDDQGRTVRYAYDGDLLVAVTAFNGLITRYSYYPADGTPTSRALRQIVYPDGNTKDFTYDAAGRVATAAVNGNLMMTEIVRGEFGSYKTIAPNGGVSSVSIGAAGEVLETVNALGQKVTRTYTEDALLESMIGPTGKRSKIAYDADGNAVKATDAAGASTTFAYTSDFGSLAKVTDARGNSFNYGYDKLGRSEQIGYADNSMERIEYSDRGDITNSVNRRGQSVAYTYDREGNVLSEVWETGRTLTWEYDAKGNCTKASDSETGDVTMEYDANEHLTRIAYPNGHGFTYAYDEYGHTISRTSFDGFAQKYEYDALGRLQKLTDGDGNPFLENVYDKTTGQLWLMKYGNGTIVSNSYDILGRTIGIYHYAKDGSEMNHFVYEYDSEGRRISQNYKEGTELYTYDTVGQLTDVAYPDGTEEHFRYDAVGNRLSANGNTYEVNNLNQYTLVGSEPRADRTSFEYDLDGNMTKKVDSTGTTEYFYDLQNRLIAVTNEAADIRWACVYDVFGNRVKVIDHGTVTEKVFVQGSLPSVAEEYSGATLKKRKIGMGSTTYVAIEGGNVSYSHEDGRMSTCVFSDADGKVKSTCAVKAFGEARVGNAHNFVDMLGVEYDDATGLYFMRNRYYDAGLGRFVQCDPIGMAAGDVNVVRCCANDPISYVDPEGTAVQEASAASYTCKRLVTNSIKSVPKGGVSGAGAGAGTGTAAGAVTLGTVVAGVGVVVVWTPVINDTGTYFIERHYQCEGNRINEQRIVDEVSRVTPVDKDKQLKCDAKYQALAHKGYNPCEVYNYRKECGNWRCEPMKNENEGKCLIWPSWKGER